MFQVHLHLFIFIITLAHPTICPCPNCEITSQPAYSINSFLLSIISFWTQAHFELGLWLFHLYWLLTAFRKKNWLEGACRVSQSGPATSQALPVPHACSASALLTLFLPLIFFCLFYHWAVTTTAPASWVPRWPLLPNSPRSWFSECCWLPWTLPFHLSPGVTLRLGEC